MNEKIVPALCMPTDTIISFWSFLKMRRKYLKWNESTFQDFQAFRHCANVEALKVRNKFLIQKLNEISS